MLRFKEWTVIHLFMFFTFVLSGLMVNLIQVTLLFTLGRISRNAFRKVNAYLIWIINAQILFIATWWSDFRLRLHLDEESTLDKMGQEKALLLMNHHYEIDWLLGWMASDSVGVLGNSRVFLKKELKYAPIVGWSLCMSDAIFLERDWQKDQLVLARGVKTLCQYPDPVLLLLFAEGTRKNAEKLAASQEYSRKRNLPVLKHHLVPRTKGFVETMKNVDPTQMPAIYDITIVMPENPASISSMLFGHQGHADMYLRRLDINQVPKDDAGAEAYLMKLYETKDQLKEHFLQHNSFDGIDQCPVKKELYVPRRIHVLLNTVILNLIICLPILCYVGSVVASGNVIQICVVVGVLGLLHLAMGRFISLTMLSKASSYGKKKE